MKEQKNDFSDWVQQFPVEPGTYWFYGNRYKFRSDEKPILLLVKVHKTGNDTLVGVAEGGFMYERELGEKWRFKIAVMPELPVL